LKSFEITWRRVAMFQFLLAQFSDFFAVAMSIIQNLR